MTERRRNRTGAARERRKLPVDLRVVSNTVMSAAEQSVSSVRPSLLRYIELHPALALLTGAVIIALVCVIYLNQVTTVSNANYALQALQQEHTRLLREQQDLQLQIGRAQSLPNIEKAARERLGMMPLGDKYSYLTITTGPITAMPPLPTPALPSDSQADGR